MIQPDRLLPQQEIYNFLRSLTIKYEPIAQYINEKLMQKGIMVNYADKRTWKYYLNMIGEYHSSDTPMYVTSLDTRQTILFSKENLAKNLRTRAVYVPGGIYYNRLCNTYPEQVDLIKSILFPVSDINQAIMADDLTLLSYGTGYLEIQEESIFISQIHKFLDILKERWYFNFLDDEPYFYITFWSHLWIYLAMLLTSGRMEHVHTPYVHSWDLWNELKAYGLDNYSDILDRQKAMALYQNISYLKINAGKQSNLLILAEKLLKDFGIGLYGRIVLQESETGKDNYQLTPQLPAILISDKINNFQTPLEIKTVETVQSEIYQKDLTLSNSAETVRSLERRLGDTVLNEFNTKFLEIRPLAQVKPYAEILNTFILETLTVSISRGYYNVPVEVSDPLTINKLYLPPKELLALYHYASLKSIGVTPVNFPNKVRLYRSFNPQIGTAAKIIPYDGGQLYLSMVVDSKSYLSGLDYDNYIESPQEFSDNLTNLWLRFLDHLLLDQQTKIDRAHYAYDYLSKLCHTRREESLSLVSNYSNYSSWFGINGIDIQSSIFDQYDLQVNPSLAWGNLADQIMSTLVPVNDILKKFGNFTLSNTGFERLRQLFVQMCSYRVVFLQADREISTFSASYKTSDHYGPDIIDALDNSDTFFVTRKNDTINSYKVQEVKIFDNEGYEIKTEETRDNNVTFVSAIDTVTTQDTIENPPVYPYQHVEVATTASLHKVYSQIHYSLL